MYNHRTRAPQTIVLKGDLHRTHEEFPAGAALKPGHLIEVYNVSGTEKVRKHSLAGGRGSKMFAKEDALQGLTISDAYAANDPVMCHIALPGDIIKARVAAGALANALSSMLFSAGDGTLTGTGSGGSEVLYENSADSAEVENTVTETAFDKSYTIPADFLQAGDIIRIRAQATVNDNNSTDTLLLKLKIGTQIIAATAAVDIADGDVGFFDAMLLFRTVGASGTFTASGVQALGVPGTVTSKPFFLESTSIDTTATKLISITATWSVAHADNEVELTNLIVEVIRGAGDSVVGRVEDEAVDNSAGSDEAFVHVRIL